MRALLTALTFVIGCLGTAPARAFYCGNRLVSPGEPQTLVWYKCGAPDFTTWRVSYRTPSEHHGLGAGTRHFGFRTRHFGGAAPHGYVPVVIEVWVYNFGPRRFLQELSFENGELIEIEPLGYGY